MNAYKQRFLIPLAILMLVTMSLSQDWPLFRGDPQHQAFAASTQDTLFENAAWTFQTGGAIFASPVVANHHVYFTSTDNFLYCLLDSTGELIWKTKLGNWCEASPAVTNGLVYVACMDHQIYAFDATNGQVVWQFPTQSWLESSPTIVGEYLYIGGTDHSFYCLNATSGQLIWKYPVGKDIYSTPAGWNGLVYFGADDHYFYALDSQGQLQWRYSTGIYSIAASPSVVDSLVVFGTIDNDVDPTDDIESINNRIIALNAISGEPVWEITVENFGLMHTSPAVADGKIFYPTDQGILRAIDLRTGTIQWDVSLPDSSFMWSSPAIAAGVVYLTTYTGKLFLFGADSGQVLGEFTLSDTSSYIQASPAIADNYLFFGASDGYLYALGKVLPTEVAISGHLPASSIKLAQNYPNPFNPNTCIRYHLLKPERVRVKVLNLQGQVVCHLLDARQAPGTHSITWNGTDAQGQSVASGPYFYQIQAGAFYQTRKMLLLK